MTELVTNSFTVENNNYTVEGLTVTGSGTNANSYTVSVSGTAVVRDSDGNDVSGEFSVTPQSGTLTIAKRDVTLASATDSKEYDGTALTNDAITVTGDGFADGENATYTVTGTRTLVGTAENAFTYALNEGTLAENYNITANNGTLTVNSRNARYSVTLKANSGTFTYDGTAKTVKGYTIDGKSGGSFTASNGLNYTIEGMSAEISGTDAGTYTMNVTGNPTVKDSGGNDVTAQFAVSVENGTLTINKRAVTLTSATVSKPYDGAALTNDTVTVSGDKFVAGEGATYTVTGTQTLPGESANAFTYALNEGTKADNYDITTVSGSLTVTDRTGEGDEGDAPKSRKYEITVTANSGEFLYDGTEHSVSGFAIAPSELKFDGVTYTVSGIAATASRTDAGETTVEISGTPVVKDGSGNDLTAQFTVNMVNGTLTVNRRSVTLTSATDSKAYDGAALTNDTVTVGGDGFAPGEGATYNVTGSQRNAGSSSNTFSYTLNSGTKADNYDITTVYGALTVDAPPFSVTAEGWTGAYDGETHSITVSAPDGAAVTYSNRRSGPYQAENYAYKDAGTYTVYYRVTADGVPETAGSAVVTITKASLSPALTLADPSNPDRTRNSWPYGGPAGAPILVMERSGTNAAVTDYGLPVYSYRAVGDTAYQSYTPQETLETLPVGNYILKAEIAESGNYYAASAETDFTVVKASHSDVTPETVKVLANSQNLPLDLSAYLPDGSACAVSEFSGNLISGVPSVANGILRFNTGASGSGQIDVRVSGPNFEDYTITVSLRGATSFMLSFDSNGGSVVKTTRSRRSGAAYSTLPTTKRTGYIFDGWFTERNGGERVTASSRMGNIDTTLYAHWTAIDYTVTLRLNGGSLSSGMSGWTGNGDAWTRVFHIDTPDFTLPEPVLEGYAFTGWIKSAELPRLTVVIPKGTAESLSYDADWMECVLESETEFSRTEADSGILGFYDAERDGDGSSGGLTDTLREIASDIAKEAAGQDGETPDVTVTLKGSTQPDMTGTPDEALNGAEQRTKQEQQAIKSAAQDSYQSQEERDGMRCDFMDVSMERTTDGNSSPVEETDRPAEVPIGYDMTGQYNPQVYSYHEDEAGLAGEASLFAAADSGVVRFERVPEKPRGAEEMKAGTFYFSGMGSDAIIYIYANKFSTYAVVTTDVETYAVFFETDGGANVDAQTVPAGKNAAKPQDPTKPGFAFDGWHVREGGEERAFDFDADVITRDTILYAHWAEMETETPEETVSPAPSGSSGSGGGSSGASAKSYGIAVADAEHGSVTVSAKEAASGKKITVTATPESGYVTDSVTVKTTADKNVSVTKSGTNVFRFTMPASDVTISASFVKQDADSGDTGTQTAPDGGDSATDAKEMSGPLSPEETGVADWLITDTHPAYISGFSDGTFRPNANITRAQAAMMFYRLLKNPNVARTESFNDMNGDEWYAEAVYALSSMGIIQGYSDGSFRGNNSITRAAFTAIVARFAKSNAAVSYDAYGDAFTDVPETHWARDTIAQASSYGWVGGYSDGTFHPAAPITRAAVTAIINRMLGRSADEAYVTAHGNELNQFSDVQDPDAWYYYNVAEAANEHGFVVADGKETWSR